MTLRMLALVLAAVLAVPAMLLLLRAPRGEGAPRVSWLSLDGLWTVVPVALLVALFALAAAA
ncbi:MAG: hypothetical protein AB7O78_10905 [Thermoleophilia bacterium]